MKTANEISRTGERKMKRLAVLFMCMAILLALVPCVNAAEIVAGGTCGDSITWTLDSEGTLVISGTGNMRKSFYNNENIKTVIIEDGITDIGYEAFYGCKNLTSVTIPDSVTNIEEGAFYRTGYYGNEANWRDNALYIGKHLIRVKQAAEGEFVICDGTKTIADNAFEGCAGLTGVAIPDSVTSIGWGAFFECSGLTSITIPDGVTDIIAAAFVRCTGLESITIPDGVTSIGSSAFFKCESLTSVTIPDSVTSIGFGAFSDCKGLTAVAISDGVTSIGEEAFGNCPGLTSVTIPGSVTDIGRRAFAGCGSLNISVDENNEKYSSADGVLFNKDKTEIIAYAKDKINTAYVIPDGVTNIAGDAFYGCENLMSITMPDGLTDVGETSFYYCRGLKSVTIPNSVAVIYNYAFGGCKSLTDVYYTGNAEEWRNIRMTDGNEYLTNAAIHYNYDPSAPVIGEVTAEVQNGGIKLTITARNVLATDKLIAAGYDEDGITAVKEAIDGEAILPHGTKRVKVFVWESLESMKPLCEAVEKTI